MIEVLVTLLIVSFGLMGIAGLQLASKRGGHLAWQRTQALSMASDIMERIGVNSTQAASYHTGLGSSAVGGGTITTTPKNCAAGTNTCTAAEVVAWDRWSWEQRLDGSNIKDSDQNNVGGLMDARGCVIFTAASNDTPNTGSVRVIISWRGVTETSDAVITGGQVCGSSSAGSDGFRHQVVLDGYVANTLGS